MKKNVLVFPCGSEIGLEVHKSLQYSTHFNLIGGNSVPDHGRFVFKNYIGDLPFVTEPDFVSKVNQVVEQHKVDFIIPTHDNVLLKLAQAKAAGNLRCELITSPIETCEIATSKLKTYQTLQDVVPVPKIYKTVDGISPSELPVFLKPEVGNGSRGTQRAESLEDMKFYLARNPSLLMLEYLPGKEYTIDCFTNKKGELLFCEGRQRTRISNGISVNSETVKDERFQQYAQKLNSKLQFRGVWFFQLKERKDGELVLMEIAPRVAGTMGLVRCKGVNLALLSLFDFMDYDVSIFENDYDMSIDRALQNKYEHNIIYSHVYLDFDDLVVFEGRVNPLVMAFVFQCRNNNIAVHLLTKHKDDLAATLETYRLNGIFDEIIHIQKEDDKHLCVKHKDAIFIDDSFAERQKVHELCNIPVFDAHAVESLME